MFKPKLYTQEELKSNSNFPTFLTVKDLQIEDIFNSMYCHEQEIIKYLAQPGCEIMTYGPNDYGRVLVDFEARKHPIKIECMERLNNTLVAYTDSIRTIFRWQLPITVHCFISPKNTKSFNTHTDPVDVFIHCIAGIKTMEVNGELFKVEEGQVLFIPANTPHRALNTHDSIMLSVGLETTIF